MLFMHHFHETSLLSLILNENQAFIHFLVIFICTQSPKAHYVILLRKQRKYSPCGSLRFSF